VYAEEEHVLHVFLSPHLDDAVLSCGGLIARLARQGESALILTIFTASVRPPFSALAAHEHALWGDPPDAYCLRRAEDMAAAARLHANTIHANLPEAIYRRDKAGQWCYSDVPGIFGPVHAADTRIADEIGALVWRAAKPPRQWYAPLAIGGHVDHALLHLAAEGLDAAGERVSFYADVPYALDQPIQAAPEMAFEPLDGEDVDAWVAAVACYRGQVPVLFGSEAEMEARIRAYAGSHGASGLALYRSSGPVPAR
jgi:LmbE family N-acetylglucosaminyl deacetylase